MVDGGGTPTPKNSNSGVFFDKETDDRLRIIAAGVSAATGEAFCRLLAQHLYLALNTDFACIGELHDEHRRTVRTIAMFAGCEFSEGVEYELEGTPCREAVMWGRCSYPGNVQSSSMLEPDRPAVVEYLLHPPELDVLGLVGALKWYVDGFEKRTGIHVVLDIS